MSLKHVLDTVDNEFEYNNEDEINGSNPRKVEKTTNNMNHAAFFSQNKSNAEKVNHEVIMQEHIPNNTNTKISE